MASARHLARGLGAASLLLLLAGCGGLPSYGDLLGGSNAPGLSARPTPPDPPPIPDRKPATPAGFSLALASYPTAAVGAGSITAVATGPTAAGSAGPTVAQQLVGPSSYRVASGETLYHVANRFGLPLRSLIDANGLRPPYTLLTGQRLDIPRPRVHQVAAGDTVFGISQRYGADVSELVRLNRIAPPYNILLGQKLVIPGSQDDPSGQGTVRVASLEATGSPGMAPAETLDGAETGAVATAEAESEQTAALPIPRANPRTSGAPSANTPVPQPPPLHGGKFLWPVSGQILSGYGPKPGGLHNDGVNIAAPRGTPIRAAENGVVAYVGNELRGFGNLLLVKHSDGWVTAYAHADTILVQRGQRVERGQVVATVGSSGHVSRPQLHFEVRKGVRTLDPARLLEARIAAAS